MAILGIFWRRWFLASLALLLAAGSEGAAQTAPSREYQIKAVFLFNFAQFVDWPTQAFADAQAPLIIGVLGDDPFDGFLDEIVRGERINNRPLAVQRYRTVDEINQCQVLFISRSETKNLAAIFARLRGRNILTVGDGEAFTRHGGMIRFATVNNKTRLKINVAAAKAVELTISSKLLRPAEIVTAGEIDR